MRILWIEDDMVPIAKMRLDLVAAGHTVEVVRQGVASAHRKLLASFGDSTLAFDCVIIDLSLPDEKVPQTLQCWHEPLAVNGRFSMNQGQAIGQWLWESEGLRQKSGRPWHCYLTQVPDQYCNHPDAGKQEFSAADGSWIGEFLVSKWTVKNLPEVLHKLGQSWNNNFRCVSQQTL